jgi:c-di-GMP-binding flagellar brake protein YcgR
MEDSAQSIFEAAIDDQRTAVVTILPGDEPPSLLGRFAHRDGEGFSFQAGSWPNGAAETGGYSVAFELTTNGAAIRAEAEVCEVVQRGEIFVVRCALPNQIEVVQRRVHFRVPIPEDSPMGLTAWKVPPHWFLRDKPKPSAQLKIQPVDVSLGGFCLRVLPGYVRPESIALDERIRLELVFQESQVIFDTRVMHLSLLDADGSVRIGIAFQKLENSIEGRRASNLLDRLIATLQRKAIQKTAAA